MARYRNNLPQLAGGLFLTDGGIETTLIFREGLELPYFAAFDLLKHDRRHRGAAKVFPNLRRDGQALWSRLHSRERNLARQHGLGRETRL